MLMSFCTVYQCVLIVDVEYSQPHLVRNGGSVVDVGGGVERWLPW